MSEDDKLLNLFGELAGGAHEGIGRVGEYVLLDLVGQGGAGKVYRAWDPRLRRHCAIKVLSNPGVEDRRRLEREARIAARLSHPGIVPVYEVGTHQELPFVALEFVDGTPLDRHRPPLREALEISRAVAEAIQYAHEQGVLHRDLKPANVLLGRDGRPRVTDFGLARLIEGGATITQSGSVSGTPSFLAPETAEGRPPDVRTDVYGLGATLYALLAGRPPHGGRTVVEILRRVSTEDPPALDVPADVRTIVARAMARDPGLRYPTAKAFAEDLGRCLAGEPILARPVSAAYRARRWVGRNRLAAALALLALLLGGALVIPRPRPSVPAPPPDISAQLDRATRAIRRAEEIRCSGEGTIGAVQDAAADAVAALDEAVRLRPKDPTAHALLGRAHHLRGELDRAEEHYTLALAAEPKLVSARYGRGRLHLSRYQDAKLFPQSHGRNDLDALRNQALEDLRQAGGVGGWEEPFARASVAFAEGRHDEALTICDAAPAGDPEAVDLHLVAAQALLALGRPREALARCDRALSLRPGYYRAFLFRGNARTDLREFAEAASDYARALRFDAAMAGVWNMLGLALYQGGADLDRAVEAFDAAIRVRPDFAEPYSNRALARIAQGRPEPAAQDLSFAIEKAPDWIVLYQNRCAVYQRLKDLDRALADAATMVARWPDDPQAWASRGTVRLLLGERSAAWDDCRMALSIDPRHVESLLLELRLLSLEKRHDEVIDRATRVLEIDPNHGQAHLIRGYAYWYRNQPARARGDWEKAGRLDPSLKSVTDALLKQK